MSLKYEWDQLKQFYNSMSLLDTFWDKNDAQTIKKIF